MKEEKKENEEIEKIITELYRFSQKLREFEEKLFGMGMNVSGSYIMSVKTMVKGAIEKLIEESSE